MAGGNIETDAFYGWQNWETTGDPRSTLGNDNPPFSTWFYSKMPIDPRSGTTNILRRGYMRPALPEKDGNTRFHFQFNPNAITRTNQVNSGLLTAADQTGSDMVVGGLSGAGADFSFSLMLDRQDEVASGKFKGVGENSTVDPDGVLIDVAAFDRVVGIGAISSDQISDFLFGGNLIQSITDLPERLAALNDLALGNQVIMQQRPVRVVFSHLFMVEGYVTLANLTYAKFSIAMVPTVASLQITMDARYIGAARAASIYSSTEAVTPTNTTSDTSTDPTKAVAPNWNTGGIALGPTTPTGPGNQPISNLNLTKPQDYGWNFNPAPTPSVSRSSLIVNTRNTGGEKEHNAMTVYANSRYLGDDQMLATSSDGRRHMTIYPTQQLATNMRFVLYQVMQGETFERISQATYGDPTQWWRVANLNPHVFFPGEIPAGTYIRRPAS